MRLSSVLSKPPKPLFVLLLLGLGIVFYQVAAATTLSLAVVMSILPMAWV